MSKLAKVAIGCAVALLLAGIAATVALVGGAFWLKGKVEQVTGGEKQIEEAQRKADSVPFAAPADGAIAEARLQKFLEIRKRVFAVYDRHRAEIESLAKKPRGEVADVARAFGWVNEIRRAQAEAMAEVGMSQAEYRFLVEAIYEGAWAAAVLKGSEAESVSEALERSAQEADRSLEQAREAASQEGVPESAREALEQAAASAKGGGEAAREAARSLDLPKANLELFRKYEADLKKYAMTGLEWLGL